MPITFNEDTNAFEGQNGFGETLAGFDFSVFGGLISNAGAIIAPVTARTDQGIEFVNTSTGTLSKAAGSQYAVDLLGNGGRLFVNDGDIFGSVRFGTGWDTFFNSGMIQGAIRTGAGNDTLTNQIIPGIDGGPETAGTITGGVFMGTGDDTVLNTGVMANVFLQGGNDTYTVGGFIGVELGDDFLPGFPGVGGGTGSAGNVYGGSGDDTLTGGTEDDRFFGGGDDDFLFGNGGRDHLRGQNGDDEIYGGDGNDYLNGGSGNDNLYGGNNNDRLIGANGNDFLSGGQGNDQLSGGNDDDLLLGGNGHDRLTGGNGNDTLEGGQGRDTLVGGDGADVFIFSGGTNQDVILGFEEGDRIDIRGFFLDGDITYADVMANTDFTGGNAVIDLSAIFNLNAFEGAPIDHGSVLTVRNVTIEDLSESAFGFSDSIFVVG